MRIENQVVTKDQKSADSEIARPRLAHDTARMWTVYCPPRCDLSLPSTFDTLVDLSAVDG